jgi:DNA-binding NtrC family response regulator
MDAQPAAAKSRHILVVDDSSDLAQSYKHLLEQQGYAATIASNGVLALKTILKTHVDVVVCDLKMPQLEGDMFYMTVQRLKPDLSRRFVFITGMGRGPRFQSFIQQVDAPVLFKPVEFDRLLAEIERVGAR